MVKISNVTLSRLDAQTLRVTLYYDLEPGVTLPLPYKTVVVTPLEPSVKIAGALSEFVLSNDSVAVDLDIPANADVDWQALTAKDACCQVSLKGMREQRAPLRRMNASVISCRSHCLLLLVDNVA